MYRESKIDYSGRTSDILLLKTVLKPVSDRIVTPDVSGTPMLTTGIEKLVQRYGILFLTGLGSVRNSESEGTEFIESLGKGRIYDENTLKAAALMANKAVIRQIQQEDAVLETPDDEYLDDAEITELSIDRSTSTVTVKVEITARSGRKFVYITPISTGV